MKEQSWSALADAVKAGRSSVSSPAEDTQPKRYPLLRLVRMVRFIAILGPWRPLFVRYHQQFGKNEPLEVKDHSLFLGLNVDETVNNIRKQGYSLGIHLSPEHANEILEFCSINKLRVYDNPHEKCETVSHIAHDPKVVEVARKYLGVEPILYCTTMYWSFPKVDKKGNPFAASSAKGFHFDVADFKSLSLFIYLSDVDQDCGPHAVIENTHNNKSFPQLVKHFIREEEAFRTYGDRIKFITGEQGTGFFEELSAYHKRTLSAKPRLVLIISYVLHRNPKYRGITQRMKKQIQRI